MRSQWHISTEARLSFRRDIMGAIGVLECAARELDARPAEYEVGPAQTVVALDGCADAIHDIADRIQGATR